MAWKLLKPEYLRAIRVVMLSGAAIYLGALGFAMAHGAFTWTPDFLGSHGEPFLVLGLALWLVYEAVMTERAKL